MAQVTWLGDGSADTNEWRGQTFKVGEAVDMDDKEALEIAKANRFYKVSGDKSPTVEDQPDPVVLPGRVDDRVENIAFAPQEVLTARRQESEERVRAEAEAEESAPKRRGRPPKAPEHGGSKTFAERVPPKGKE